MPMPTEVSYHVSHTSEELSRFAADRLLSDVEAAVAARGIARIAISGGNTPKPMFELLANPAERYVARMPWGQLELYWVDERCVPPDHPDSNYRMTLEAMLAKVPLPAEQVFRMEGELDPELAAARYESAIRRQFGLEGDETPVFDAISLGMGEDGHTASLFPNTRAVQEARRIVVANDVPQKNMWRLTLTWPVINAARSVSFLLQGSDKSQVLRDVLQGPYNPEVHPSQLIRPDSGKLEMLLDDKAAALLPAPGNDSWGRLEIGEVETGE